MLPMRVSVKRRTGILVLLLALLTPALLQAQTPPLAGIAHVAFRVGNLDQTRAFYQKLGFEQFLEFSSAGKPSVAFMKINDRQFIELYAPRDDSQPLGLMHVCYESHDIAAVHDAYASGGLTPSDVKKAHAGNLLFVIHDPEDQPLEYTQYEPGSLHSLDRGKHLGPDRVSRRLIGAILPVRDVPAEEAFYRDKLGFESSRTAKTELLLPGGSASEIELEEAAATTRPGIAFEVDNVKRTAKALRHRGFAVEASGHAVSVQDPDGVLVVFRKTDAQQVP